MIRRGRPGWNLKKLWFYAPGVDSPAAICDMMLHCSASAVRTGHGKGMTRPLDSSSNSSGRQVLICAKGYPPDVGGVQTYSEFVARAYLKAGWQPVIISSRPGQIGWIHLAYPEGSARLMNVGTGKQAVLFLKMLGAARKLLRSERFAYVHPTTWRPALALAPWRGRLPMVLTVHGQEVLTAPKFLAPGMRAMLRAADLLVAVSNPTLDAARRALAGGRPGGHWIAAHNGLSYEEEARAWQRPAHDGGPVRLYSFCRLAERKNIVGALHALKIVRDQGVDNFTYEIAGGGPMKAEIATLIDTLGLSDKVTMAGYIDESEIAERYRKCDVFLHPQTAPRGGNDLEGFGLAIADAMSFGALAIVGSAGGPADFVTDDANGIVVDGDDTPAIAAAIAAVLRDSVLRERLAKSGRDWVLDHLSWDRHVAKILGGVAELTKTGDGAAR